jgi:tagaturonate reductase
MTALIKALERQLDGRPRPTPRVLQFGQGNFLRAFLDWKIDLINARGGLDWGVVIVRSLARGAAPSLNDQDGLYTVLTRGVDSTGEAVSQPHVVACVRRELEAGADWLEILALARHPDIAVVASNTTDAGIVYQPCAYDAAPPASFPAKVARLLHERWLALGEHETGWRFLPCELIERNGEVLQDLVLRHADDWGLPAAFLRWVAEDNAFYNTLVDRIVPGFPRDEAEILAAALGYQDPFLVAAEQYHLLVIERRSVQPEPLPPLAAWDDGSVVVEDVTPFRQRKVALLNGGHTALCPLALIGVVETVGEAVRSAAGEAFLRGLFEQEIIPFLDLPADSLREFAEDVLRRFANPFIRHYWRDISLNGLAKFRVRNLPSLLAYLEREGAPPPRLSLSLAAWLTLYLGRFPAAESCPPRDSEAVLARLRAIGGHARSEEIVSAFLADTELWGSSLDRPALRQAVLGHFEALSSGPFDFGKLANTGVDSTVGA